MNTSRKSRLRNQIQLRNFDTGSVLTMGVVLATSSIIAASTMADGPVLAQPISSGQTRAQVGWIEAQRVEVKPLPGPPVLSPDLQRMVQQTCQAELLTGPPLPVASPPDLDVLNSPPTEPGGNTLDVEVADGHPPGGGDLQFRSDFTSGAVPPNDHCANAHFVSVPSSTPGTTTGADVDADAPTCQISVTAPGVWYKVGGTGGTMTATVCNAATQFDTKITVYCDNCGNLGPEHCVVGNDDDCIGHYSGFSTAGWCSQYGVDYLILVHGYGSASGDFVLDVLDDGVACYGAVDCGGDAIGACCINGGGTCMPGICGEFSWCGAGGCICGLSAEGDGVCANGMELCTSLLPCPNGSADCPAGRFCWIGSCCDGPVCGQACPGASQGGKTLQNIDLDLTPMGSTPVGDGTDASTSCVEILQTFCESANGDYRGDGVSCAPDPCFGDLGACCVAGDCVGVMVQTACEDLDGQWFLGEDCATVACPVLTGACCPGYACIEGYVCSAPPDAFSCNGTLGCVCAANAEGGISCIGPQACGDPCPHGSSDCPLGSVCALDTCCPEGRPTCLIDGCPVPLPPERQLGPGEVGPTGTVSADLLEDTNGLPPGCQEFESWHCELAGAAYLGDGTVCLEDTCPLPGACCFNDGSCVDALADECAILGGNLSPEGTSCFGDQDGNGVDDVCEGVFCGDGAIDAGEECDGGVCCTDECLFDDTTVCRPAAGACDVAESCNGMAPGCPPDDLAAAGTECRASAHDCDPPEQCTGTSAACPTDAVITECISGDDCCPEGCEIVVDHDCAPTGIPTASAWGLLAMAILLLVGAKVYYGRRVPIRRLIG